MQEIICNAKYKFMKPLLPRQSVTTLPNHMCIPVPLTGLHCRSFTAIHLRQSCSVSIRLTWLCGGDFVGLFVLRLVYTSMAFNNV